MRKIKELLVETSTAALTGIGAAATAMAVGGPELAGVAVEAAAAVPFARLFSWSFARFRPFSEGLEQVANKLEDAGVDVAALADSVAFQNVVLEATRIAIRDGREEKRLLLFNAITNAALREERDANRVAILMRLVDQLTPFHVRLLDVVRDPQKWCERNGCAPRPPHGNPSLREWVDHCLGGEFEPVMLLQAWEDLFNFGLLQGPREDLDRRAPHERRIQLWGMSSQLLEFISEPRFPNSAKA